MPRNVTMHGPHSRIIRSPLEDNISLCRQQVGVTSLRVAGVDDSTVPGASSRRKNLPRSYMSGRAACKGKEVLLTTRGRENAMDGLWECDLSLRP